MPLRNHAVVVEPRDWDRTVLELARLLVPVTGAEAGALAKVLERGPMTVEADLSETDASALSRRLKAMGIPARVQQNGTRLESEGPGLSEETDGEGMLRMPGAKFVADMPSPPGGATPPSKPPPRPDRPALKLPDPPADDRRRRTVMNLRPMASEAPSGWGEVFPDLVEEPTTIPPTLDELEEDRDDALPPALVPDKMRDTLPPEVSRRLADRTHDDDDEPPVMAARRESTATPAGLPVARDRPKAATAPPSQRAVAAPPPQTLTRPPRRDAPPPKAPDRFEGGALIAELVSDERERPPYAPTGFDARPEHLPGVAMALSIIAPGAGQVFNGDFDEAMDYGLKFWLIKPWLDSVKDARAQGEKIHSYWAPRPEPGTFARALRYTAGWWVCVAVSIGILYWLGGRAFHLATRQPPGEVVVADLDAALDEAQTTALGARVAALDAVSEAVEQLDAGPRFTMSDQERAERLFVLGYLECRSHNMAMCEQMMKRVSALQPGNVAAIKLQAWASVRQRGDRNAKFPDIGDVPTLSEWELQKMRDEMIIEGENVPPPPDPQDSAPDDAAAPELDQPAEPETDAPQEP